MAKKQNKNTLLWLGLTGLAGYIYFQPEAKEKLIAVGSGSGSGFNRSIPSSSFTTLLNDTNNNNNNSSSNSNDLDEALYSNNTPSTNVTSTTTTRTTSSSGSSGRSGSSTTSGSQDFFTYDLSPNPEVRARSKEIRKAEFINSLNTRFNNNDEATKDENENDKISSPPRSIGGVNLNLRNSINEVMR